MNLFQVADFYIDKLVNTPSRKLQNSASTNNGSIVTSHIKVLLLDDVTVQTISMCTTQSKLLENEIYLVEKLENQVNKESMRQLRCICFLEPSETTIGLLCKELQNPKYGEYQVFFNNSIAKTQLERIASSDELECVTIVQDFFQDYFIINKHLFSFELDERQIFKTDGAHKLWKSQHELNKVAEKLLSVMLSLKISPVVVHEISQNKTGKLLAETVVNKIQTSHKALFDFSNVNKRDSPPLLIVLDRFEFDPITPLLQPWTYQSMIKEYLNIERNVVDVSEYIDASELGDDDDDEELKKIVLNCRQDSFFEETMFLNFGDLSDKVKSYLGEYKKQVDSKKNGIDSLQDIKKFIVDYPEFKKISFNVSKHMTLVSALDKCLKKDQIWSVSELQQTLATTNASLLHEDYQTMLAMLKDESIQYDYKLKMVAIYVCVYFRIQRANGNKLTLDSQITELMNSVKPLFLVNDVNFLYYLIKQYTSSSLSHSPHENRGGTNSTLRGPASGIDGSTQNSGQGENDLFAGLAKKFNQHINIKDARPEADNVYMQYEPKLKKLLHDLNGNSQRMDFTNTYRILNGKNNNQKIDLPQDVVIYIVGGVTFEENRIVEEFNLDSKRNHNMRVILGGDKIYNSSEYIDSLKTLYNLGSQ